MKYLGIEISNMWDAQLIVHYQKCLSLEADREIASKHHKFTRTDNKAMEFPPPNPAFLELKSALLNEIYKRNLEI